LILIHQDAWAGRTARRAAEACKSEACDGGGGSGDWLVGVLVLIGLLALGAIINWLEERKFRSRGKTSQKRDTTHAVRKLRRPKEKKPNSKSKVLIGAVPILGFLAVVLAVIYFTATQTERWNSAQKSDVNVNRLDQLEFVATGLSTEQHDEPVRYEEHFPERQHTYVDLPSMVPLCTSQTDADHIYYSQRLERWDVILNLIEEGRCVIFNQIISVYTLSSTKMWASWEFDPVNFIQVRVNNEPYWLHRDSINSPLVFEKE